LAGTLHRNHQPGISNGRNVTAEGTFLAEPAGTDAGRQKLIAAWHCFVQAGCGEMFSTP
jgi:hypothetical protein